MPACAVMSRNVMACALAAVEQTTAINHRDTEAQRTDRKEKGLSLCLCDSVVKTDLESGITWKPREKESKQPLTHERSESAAAPKRARGSTGAHYCLQDGVVDKDQ